MRARVTRAIGPAIAAIELGDQREPAMLGGIEMTRQFGDLRLEFIERTAEWGVKRISIHGSDSEAH